MRFNVKAENKERKMHLIVEFDSKYRLFTNMQADDQDIQASIDRETNIYISELRNQISATEEGRTDWTNV
jgi:hypothetical protein